MNPNYFADAVNKFTDEASKISVDTAHAILAALKSDQKFADKLFTAIRGKPAAEPTA